MSSPFKANEHKEQWPLSKSLFYIFASILLINGSAWFLRYAYLNLQQAKQEDVQYNIALIEQTGPQKEVLKTIYLAQLMQLAIDRPTNIHHFNTKQAEQRLLQSPLIKTARVKKKMPQTIYIDYTTRVPLAYLHEYTNTAIDESGFSFPVQPYLSAKKLPQIYLGLTAQTDPKQLWGKQLQSRAVDLAVSLLQQLSANPYAQIGRVQYIDVSQAYHTNFCKREIVLMIEEQITKEELGKPIVYLYPRILRLTLKEYLVQLKRYLALRPTLLQQAIQIDRALESIATVTAQRIIVDLRLPQLAFIQSINAIEPKK